MNHLFVLVLLAGIVFCEEEKTCAFKGTNYKNGDTWVENNAFKMKCIVEPNGSWRTEIAGCLTPSGLEIPVGSTKEEKGMDWTCEKADGGSVSLKQARNKNADCDGGHKQGEKWVESSFEFECAEGGVKKFAGCVTPAGVKIADGETKEVDGNKLLCKKHANGTIALGSSA